MTPSVADTQRLIELHADGGEAAMEEATKLHRSFEPKPKPRSSSSSSSRKRSASKSKK